MNVIKFNKFERVAGLFVGIAILGFFMSLVSVAIKQGWFDRKVYYSTSFVNGDGIHVGTTVQISGLKAGSVDEVELTKDNQIMVKFYVLSKFEDKVREDSVAQLIRPFVIGERVLDLSVGSESAKMLPDLAHVNSQEALDLMTIMSGKQLGNYLTSMSGMVENLKTLVDAFADKNRTQSFIQIFDRIDPLLKNLSVLSVEAIKMSKQVNKDDNLGVLLTQAAKMSKELNALLPEIKDQAPQMAKDVTKLVSNLAILTEEFKVVIPALAEIAPDLPYASRRAVEALDEAVVLIKAMEKSFFVRSNAQDVREEEAKGVYRRPPRNPANIGK